MPYPIHQDQSPYHRRFGGGGTPAPFRRPFDLPRQTQVKGGRWSIRRYSDGRWRAWTKGNGNPFNGYFWSQADAMWWATSVANAFANPDHKAKIARLEQLKLKRQEMRQRDRLIHGR